MASLIAKKKANQLYYYVAESARVDGKPRIVHQTYLGTAERVAALVKQGSAPLPLSATAISYGLPGALWLAAQQSGVWDVLQAMAPAVRSGPSAAHYLLLAAIHRICQPGPKSEVAGWYRESVLHSLWGLDPERFTSQAFWDCFDRLLPETAAGDENPLERAQAGLLARWQEQGWVSRRVLAYDTTNFYTYVASSNTRNRLAQRGHNKQGRHNLRQVGLSYVLDGENGLSLCHHVYPGNVTDAAELPAALERITGMLDRNGLARDGVTLVLDKGSAAVANTLALDQAGVGWISALPWNQAPPELRARPLEQLPALGEAHAGVRAAAQPALVHGRHYQCVIQYSAPFAGEQLHSLTASLTKALQAMRRLAAELGKPGARFTEPGLRRRIDRWLSPNGVGEVVRYRLESRQQRWQLNFEIDNAALESLWRHRLGRTVLISNRLDWTAAQVVAAYAGQQHIERVFRGLKDGHWLEWGPMHHWTDSKIRVHAFYCMLGISLLQFLHAKAKTAWPGLSLEELIDQLRQIQQFHLLYPPLGDKGPPRLATVLSKQTLVQTALAQALGLDELRDRPRR